MLYYSSVYILIAVGAVMMVVGFLGCYGAIQESQCLLGTNCHTKIVELFTNKIYLIGIAALVVAVIIVSTGTDLLML
ncbi:hypothetical protein CRUP_010420 [Coryphaenoides rupestris]|nr:hypothetical protein CRUP_010420 [Coryphaenoides rupestris]